MVNTAEKVLFLSSFCAFVLICLGKLALQNVISYKELAYTKYQPWNLHGEMTFIFKTSQDNGLLAYQDDGKHSFMELFLVDGNLRLKAGLGGCDIQEILIRKTFSDGFWHQMRIKSQPKNFTISVDDRVASIPCGPPVNHRFKYYGNFLYVANFPPLLVLNALVFPGAFHEGYYYRYDIYGTLVN